MNHTSIAFAVHDRRSNRILKAKKERPRNGGDDSAPISDAAVRDEAQGKKLSAKQKKKLLKEVQSLCRSSHIFEQLQSWCVIEAKTDARRYTNTASDCMLRHRL